MMILLIISNLITLSLLAMVNHDRKQHKATALTYCLCHYKDQQKLWELQYGTRRPNLNTRDVSTGGVLRSL